SCVNADEANRLVAAVVAMMNVRILDFSRQAPGRAPQGMRQLHGEFAPLRLWPSAPIARCLAVPEVDGNRVARRKPNDGPRLSKRRWPRRNPITLRPMSSSLRLEGTGSPACRGGDLEGITQ